MWAAALVLAAATVIVYVPSLGNGFTNWDDGKYVTENRPLHEGLSWQVVGWAFTTGHSANWHPLTWLSHALDVELYGLGRPWGHHLTSIVLHALNAALLLVVLWRLTRRLWPSAVIAALFALHPLHVESVGWIAERKDVLCTTFMLLALWAYASYAARPTWQRYLLVVAAFAAALMAKPMAVTLPAVMLVLDWWPLRRLSWRSVCEKLPLLAMAAASSVVTFLVQRAGGAMQELERVGFGERLAGAAYAYVMYVVKAAWPAPGTLLPLYPLAASGGPAIAAWQAAAFIVLLAAVSVLAVRQRRRRPYLLAGWLIYLGTLVPVIGLVQVGQQVMADRYTYVPLVGVFVALVWLVSESAARSARLQSAVAGLAALALALFGTLTWHQQAAWHDSFSLWQPVATAYPDCYAAHDNLGQACWQKRDLARATWHYRRAVQIRPDSPLALNNLAFVLVKTGSQAEVDEALGLLGRAARLDPMLAATHYIAGQALVKKDRTAEAAAAFARAVQLDPDLYPARAELGAALFSLGLPDEAIPHLERVLEIDPRYVTARVNLAAALIDKGRFSEAVDHLQQATAQSPTAYQPYYYLGMAMQGLKRPEEARKYLDRAAELKRQAQRAGRD